MLTHKSPLRRSVKPMKRSKLAAGKPLKRRTKLRQVNPERAARQRLEDFGPEAEWMRDLPCATCPRRPPSEPSHVKSRGAGGKRWNMLPMCPECHQELHDDGIKTFEFRRVECKLLRLAEEYAKRWAAEYPSIRGIYEDLFRARYPVAGRLMEAR